MKTVIISRNEKELTRVPLNQKNILAGRSPSCDAVVRYKGVKPVQFIIEHVSENLDENSNQKSNQTDFDSGFWTLIDISESENLESEKRSSSSGAGIVLDTNKQSFNGFDFKIVTDTLQETDLKKGVISRSIDHSQTQSGQENSVIEVIYFRKDLDIVTNISHLNRNKTSRRIKLFPQQLPDFIFEWTNQDDTKALLKSEKSDKKFDIFKRGERITQNFIDEKSLSIKNDDVIHISTESDDFYLRLVPEIDVQLEKFSWLKDFMIRAMIGIFAFVSMLVVVLKNFTPEPEPPPEPPRIIKIDIPAPPPQEVPAEKAEIVLDEKTVEPKASDKVKEKPVEPKTDLAAVEKPKNKPAAAAPSTVINRPQEKPKMGLNNNAKPKDVNTIGLLAKLKNGQTATKQKVSADSILNQGVVSETMTGETGKVVINKAPSGIIGRSKEPANPNALAQASTSLSGASNTDAKNSNGLAMAGGTGRSSTGTQLNGLKSGGGGGLGESAGRSGVDATGSGFDRGEAMQAVGGLDKDSIRKALRENRRAITNCYEKALLTKKQLDGRMTFRWVIAADGNVLTTKLQSSDIGMPNFESCVEGIIKSIKFPQAPNKAATTVIYPFLFQGKK